MRDPGYCVYFNPVKFDWDTNIVILSATADDKLYKEYFNDRIFEVHQVRKATYSGIVKQYTKYPLSRNAIFKIDRKILYKHVRKITGECPIITFKSIKKKKNLLHFGNTEGIDIYKGKTIAVMGTPYPYPGEVVLWYYLLRHKYPDKQCNFYNNQYGSYTFCSYCYKDELMRRIQTYLIVSELEQAVGRARLLRNNCTVYVFSNYPVDQAIIYADPYLEDKS